QLRLMLAGNANALADGAELAEPTEPTGTDSIALPLQFARIAQYLSMATPLLWSRQPDQVGVLGLAITACAERNGHGDEADRSRELLVAARDLWATVPDIEEEVEARQTMRLTHRLVHMAQIEAITCNGRSTGISTSCTASSERHSPRRSARSCRSPARRSR